ncbi:MAG: sigma-70 family RNA polymerase sigma factor [Phycisphaerae bacterium]
MEAAMFPQNLKLIEQLVREHEQRIRRFISRRSGPAVLRRATVEDLFQDTVMAAYSSAASFQFQGDSSFLGWISTIARRVIARCAAGGEREPATFRIKRPESTGVGVYETELAPRSRTPSSLVAADERKSALLVAIDQLPPEYRRIVTMYKLEERSLADIATLTGRDKDATCHLIARAYRKLRESLKDDAHAG